MSQTTSPQPQTEADQWYANFDYDEQWDGPASPTRREAALTFIAEHGVTSGEVIETGRSVQYPASHYLPGGRDALLEGMQEKAYDEVGECSESWELDDQAARRDLRARLAKVIDEWATAHGLHPKFFHIEDTERHTVTAADVEEALSTEEPAPSP